MNENRSNWKWTAVGTFILLLVLALVWFSQVGATSLNSSIQGQTFNDLNRDGILQDGEPGIANVTVCASGSVTECAVSSQWNYSIENLPPGEYLVYVSEIPQGMEATSPLTLTVNLTNTNAMGINFGFASLTNEEPDFPSCEDLTPPGDWSSSYGDFHVPGIAGSFFGQDDVYNLGDGNAVQCGCPDGETMGWQTNWWKPQVNPEYPPDGWYYMSANWNLPADPPYWFVSSKYVCNEQTQPLVHLIFLPIVQHDEPQEPPPPAPTCPQQIRVTYLNHSEVVDFQVWPGTMRTLGLFAAGTTLRFEMIEGTATQSNLSWPSWYALQGSGPEWVFQPTSTEVPPHPGLGIPYEFHVWNSAPGQPYCLASFQMQWDPPE